MTTVLVPADELRRLVVRALESAGIGLRRACLQADNLVEADLRGHGSHGASRLPVLLERIAHGLVDTDSSIVVTRHSAVAATVEAAGELGPVAADAALTLATAAAREQGVGVVAIRHAGHLGLLGAYVERAARDDMVCVITSTTEAMVHAPHSIEPLLGTNPIAIGIPVEGGEPIVVDMAKSTVSMGEVLGRARRGQPVPTDWGRDAQGERTVDAAALTTLSTFGGAKGYALALAVGTFTATITGTAVGSGVVGTLDTTADSTKGDLVICISPALFGGVRPALDLYLSAIRGSETDGTGQPWVPGDRSRVERERRLVAGVPLDADVYAAVVAAASEERAA